METPRTTHRKKTVKLDSYENLMLNVGDLYVDDDQCALQVHEQCLVDTECQIINNTALKVEQTSNKHTKKINQGLPKGNLDIIKITIITLWSVYCATSIPSSSFSSGILSLNMARSILSCLVRVPTVE